MKSISKIMILISTVLIARELRKVASVGQVELLNAAHAAYSALAAVPNGYVGPRVRGYVP